MNLPGGGMPSPEYLAALQGVPAPAPAGPVASFAPPPEPLVTAPPAPPMIGPVDVAGPPPPPPDYFPNGPAPDAPPPPAPTAAAGPGPEAAPARPRPFLERVHGAGSYTAPAHETELRGPQLKAAEGKRNDAYAAAVEANNDRTQNAIIDEKLLMQEQERQAIARREVQEQAAAAHAEEMAQRTKDFDHSVKALSAQSIDPGRFWASAGTGQKVAALVSSALGGFVSGMTGGRNVGLDMINTAIDRDIKAQEMAYQATRDTMNAKQTAFSMAMQKYNNADQARAAVRAASLDTVQAQMGQQAALWKGTEAANRAQIASAQLEDEKRAQIQRGVQFTPAKTVGVGASYVDPRTGLTYSEGEAKGLVKTMDANEFEREKIGLNTAGEVIKEQTKGGAGSSKDKRERWVPTSSTGQGYFAPTEKEGVEHREKQAVTQEVIDLVDKLKADSRDIGVTGRAAAASGLPGTSTPAVKRIETNHKALMGAINRAQKFGALDKGATELLKDMTGDPFSIKGNEVNLDALSSMARENRRQLERSATGEKPQALPPSLQFHDGAAK